MTMSMIRFLGRTLSTLRSPDPLPHSADETRRLAAKRVVQEVATGNVHLQFGKFNTRDDIDRLYERVKSYDLDP